MQSPAAEWAIITGTVTGLVVGLDLIRARCDADGDTLSEVVRDAIDAIPHGDALLAGGLAASGTVFWRHICR